VYFVDTVKGALPVALLPRVLPALFGGTSHPQWGMAFGVAAILGHVRPVFLRGKGGGKGVATASGVFLALVPLPAAGAMISFIAVAAASRYISLASLVGSLVLVSGVVVQYGARSPYFVLSAAIAAFVFYTHRENIARLRAGTERRLGDRSAAKTAKPEAGANTPEATDVANDIIVSVVEGPQ
jgi:glycerol-3-phosphate acyltransferase PlsY